MENNFDLNLVIPESNRKVVELNEQFRQVIIHKSGIVDETFRKNTGITDQSAGEKLYVNERMNANLKYCISSITGEVQRRIYDKYFSKK